MCLPAAAYACPRRRMPARGGVCLPAAPAASWWRGYFIKVLSRHPVRCLVRAGELGMVLYRDVLYSCTKKKDHLPS